MPQRMNLSRPQGFIHIYVAEPRQNGLIQQQCLELPAAGTQSFPQNPGSESVAERLRSQLAQNLVGIRHTVSPSKLTCIVKDEPPAIIEPDAQVLMGLSANVPFFKYNLPVMRK
jgi:hypothetical protein